MKLKLKKKKLQNVLNIINKKLNKKFYKKNFYQKKKILNLNRLKLV